MYGTAQMYCHTHVHKKTCKQDRCHALLAIDSCAITFEQYYTFANNITIVTSSWTTVGPQLSKQQW